MESPGNPLAFHRFGQVGTGFQDVWSPNKEAPCRGQKGTPASSPCSASSVCSSMRLANYGADMNRDFAVITLLEDKLGREVEHEELQAAIANFSLVHGQLPSIRQLALELGSHPDGCGGATDTAGSPAEPTPRDCQLSSATFRDEDDDFLPYSALLKETNYFGQLRALRCQGIHQDLLSNDPLRRLRSPCGHMPQSPSRFCTTGSLASRTQLGSSRQLEPQWQESAEGSPTRMCTLSAEASSAAPPVDGVTASGKVVIEEQPAPRPFVPGLNLRGIKKKSPTHRGGPSPPSACASPAVHLHAPGGPGAVASGQRTPDTCSPTEILRMLLPSAYKPRPSGTPGPPRNWSPAHTQPLPDSREADGVAAAVAAAATDVIAESQCVPSLGILRQLDCLRVSMDDLDQHQTGPRRAMTPVKVLPGAPLAADSMPDLIRCTPHGAVLDKQPCGTPGSRGRRHNALDQDLVRLVDRATITAEASAAMLHGTAKRQLLLPPAQQPRAGDAGTAAGIADGHSLDDSDLRSDTPSKAASGTASAVASSRCAGLGMSPLRGPAAVAAEAGGVGGGSKGRPPLHVQSQGTNTVPPLRLPVSHGTAAPALGTVGVRTSARHRVWPSTGPIPPQSSACVPPLALGLGADSGARGLAHMTGQYAAAPQTGARTRRLSICLPSALIYGEGPLTTRRMAAGANTGVTSHALCTVFWAESEDDLNAYDDSEYDTDDLEEREDAQHLYCDVSHAVDDGATDHHVAAQDCAVGAAAPAHAGSLPATPGGHARRALARSSGGGNRPRLSRARGRRRRRRGHGQAEDEEDPDRCSGGLMLPEQLWDAWERLSDGPKGRQYRLLESLTHVERITCTSYSTVSKACHQGQPVVVKIYDVAERDKLANAFAEIGVLLHLAGWPGAVRLLDYGRHEDKVMLMLESCDHSLKDWCDSQRFDTATGADYIMECLRLWCTLAELLTELHERWHVAHCDLKPGNVLLSGGQLRLADFSESMLFNETPLLQDQARGTVPYQPPEMVHGHCVDARKADVWAMGCILYEMVTGELLFRGNNDCMRAVAAGPAAARLRLLRHQHGRNRGSSRAAQRQQSGGAQQRPPLQQQSHHPVARVGAAVAADAVQTGAEKAALALWERGANAGAAWQWHEGADAAGEASTAAGTAAVAGAAPSAPPPPPRVPKLALALARGSSPWRHPQTAASGSYSGAGVGSSGGGGSGMPPALALPPHFLMAPGGGSAMCTGRSLELIAEGCCGEDASSLASDPWVAPSVLNTAPTTARSTARSQMPYEQQTARSVASTSTAAAAGTGCWPPAPPPSAGTARSVADSEWTLAVASHRPTATTAAGVGYGGCYATRSCAGTDMSSHRSTAGPYGNVDGGDSAGGDAAVAAAAEPPLHLLPPHRRLRHSVATQCADPAGPDWLTTEEADRLRIMCDEPPSFVLVHYHGGGTASTAGGAAGYTAPGRGHSDTGADGDGGMAAVAAELRDLYEPRLLSGADGPSLCDDVLSLLRAVLVEDHARPSMRQVAVLGAEVLQRHRPQHPRPSNEGLEGLAEEDEEAAEDGATVEEEGRRQHHGFAGSEIDDDDLGDFDEMDVGLVSCRTAHGVAVGGEAALAAAAQGAWYFGAEPHGLNSSPAPRGPRVMGLRLAMPGAATAGGPAAFDIMAGNGMEDAAAAAAAAAGVRSLGGTLPPRLCLNVLPERPSSCYDGSISSATANAAGGAAASAWTGPLTTGTDGGSWAGSSSFGEDLPLDVGLTSGGAAAAAAAAPPAAAAAAACCAAPATAAAPEPGAAIKVSLFDVSQPLVTARGSRPYSRSWQRFLTKQ